MYLPQLNLSMHKAPFSGQVCTDKCDSDNNDIMVTLCGLNLCFVLFSSVRSNILRKSSINVSINFISSSLSNDDPLISIVIVVPSLLFGVELKCLLGNEKLLLCICLL